MTSPRIVESPRRSLKVALSFLAGALTLAVSIGSTVIPAFFLMGAALLDPILITVTEDDYWIEIDRWWV